MSAEGRVDDRGAEVLLVAGMHQLKFLMEGHLLMQRLSRR
jgi:hypothetical protein